MIMLACAFLSSIANFVFLLFLFLYFLIYSFLVFLSFIHVFLRCMSCFYCLSSSSCASSCNFLSLSCSFPSVLLFPRFVLIKLVRIEKNAKITYTKAKKRSNMPIQTRTLPSLPITHKSRGNEYISRHFFEMFSQGKKYAP